MLAVHVCFLIRLVQSRLQLVVQSQMGVVGLSVFSALVFIGTISTGMTAIASGYMMLVCIGVSITYSYGGRALSNMLDSSPKHGDETEVKGGMCRGCKGGGSSGKEVNVRMVVSTANSMVSPAAIRRPGLIAGRPHWIDNTDADNPNRTQSRTHT